MLNSLTDEIISVLNPAAGKKVFLTVGNSWRGDDGVGPYIGQNLSRIPGFPLVDAGSTPENILDDVLALKPETLVILDAADFGGQPGDIRIIPADSIPQATLSTHAIPLNVITSLVAQETGAKIIFVGVQPGNMRFEEGLSLEVQSAAELIILTVRNQHNISQ
jgi:hydrogenase maturation protease HycI